MENIDVKGENTPVIQYTTFEDTLMASQSLFSAVSKPIIFADTISQEFCQTTASSMLNSNPILTPLENVYLTETPVTTSSLQYIGNSGSYTSNVQSIFSSSSGVPIGGTFTDLVPQLGKDEGIGSSPSASSSSPPLDKFPLAFGQNIPSRPSSNSDCFHRSSSNSPASVNSTASTVSNYSTAPECSNCGNRCDIFWCNTHYLCRQCLPERPTVVTAIPSVIALQEQANVGKRKRSSTAARSINQVCTNCEATYSKLWRRSISSGDTVCNACGLYEKLHNVPRPKSMRKDSIQTRKRKPKVAQSPKSKKSPRKIPKKLQEVPDQQQYITNSIQNYTLPNYQSFQVRNFYPEMQRSHASPMIPTMNHQSLYTNQRNDLYRHDMYNSVPPNDIINISPNVPSQIMQFTNS